MFKKLSAFVLPVPIIFMLMGNTYAVKKMICPKIVICRGAKINSCAVIGNANWQVKDKFGYIDPGVYPLIGAEYKAGSGLFCVYKAQGRTFPSVVRAQNKVFGNYLSPDFKASTGCWTKDFDEYVCPDFPLVESKPIDPAVCPFIVSAN